MGFVIFGSYMKQKQRQNPKFGKLEVGVKKKQKKEGDLGVNVNIMWNVYVFLILVKD